MIVSEILMRWISARPSYKQSKGQTSKEEEEEKGRRERRGGDKRDGVFDQFRNEPEGLDRSG